MAAVGWADARFPYRGERSALIVIDVDGESQIVSLMVEGVAGFEPATGAQRWFHPHKTDYDVNATTPVCVLQQASILTKLSWTVPTLIGTRL